MENNCNAILNGLKFEDLIPVKNIIQNTHRVPKNPGVYFWFFRNVPPVVPTEDCLSIEDTKLLYIGISPGHKGGRTNLHGRINMHLGDNADFSTLRMSLGAILWKGLKLELQRKSENGYSFLDGEKTITEWMAENAYIYYIACEQPWEMEIELIKDYSLPLNIQHNYSHPFCKTLRELRTALRERAKELPIAKWNKQDNLM